MFLLFGFTCNERDTVSRAQAARGPLAGQGLTGLAVALHVGGPEREVVAQQLHDERGVLVRLLGERVQLGDGVVEGRLGQPARAVRAVQDFVVEYLQHANTVFIGNNEAET